MRSASVLLTMSMLLLGSGSGVAQTEPATVPVELDVVAPAGCTSQQDLAARITRRQARVRFGDKSSALQVHARFSASSGGKIVAELTLVRSDSKPTLRQIVAGSCSQAAEAVALIVAITVDPSTPSELLTSAPNAGENAMHAGPAPPGVQTDAPSKQTAEAAQAPEGEFGVTRQTHQTAERSKLRLGVQLAGHALFGVAPGSMPGVTLLGMVGLDRASLVSPALMLGLTHAWKSHIERPAGTAEFALDLASLDACMLRFSSVPVEARLCANAAFGRLSATGRETIDSPGTVRRPFVVAGFAANLGLRLHPLVELAMRPAIGANLVQDSFEFAPDVFHRVGDVSYSISVGLGVRSR